MATYRITGRLLDAIGNDPGTHDIKVFRQTGVRSETEVDAATSGTGGAYVLEWTDANPPSTGMDVVVRAYDGVPAVVASSHILFAIPEQPEEVKLDLILADEAYVGPPEFTRVSGAVTTAISPMEPKDIIDTDLEYTSKRADTFPTRVATYAQAEKLALGQPVSSEAFYAFARAGLPIDKAKLLRQSNASLRSALQRAYDRNILAKPGDGSQSAIDTEIDSILAGVDEMRVDAAVELPSDPDAKSMRRLLDTAGFSEADQREFHETWLAHTGTTAEFWSTIRQSSTFGISGAATLAFTLQASMLTRQYLPALEGLQALRTGAQISTFSDLAAWTRQDWIDFLSGSPLIGAPEDMPGEDEAERIENYAKTMVRIVEEAHPTAVVAAQLDINDGTPDLQTFFADNPLFDLTRDRISVYLENNPNATDNVNDVETAIANLKTVQRLHNITPRFERNAITQVLYSAGFTSGLQIAQMGQAAFVKQYAAAFAAVTEDGEAAAKEIFEKAATKQAIGLTFMGMFGAAMSPVGTTVFPAFVASFSGPGMADLETLFGSLDYCACEHCRSVFSPSAYLVELLEFLRVRPGEIANNTGFTVLGARRLDISLIELSCKNTNTVMPYIDLVNEVLEYLVMESGQPTSWHQTTLETEVLVSHPEHLNVDAYGVLANGVGDPPSDPPVYPWVLPFDLFDTERRIYLEHLGARLHDVLRTLLGDRSYSGGAAVASALGISELRHDIIAGDHVPSGGTDAFWNLSGGAGWSTTLRDDVELLLERAGLTYEELLDLVETRFVDPGDNIEIGFSPPSCNLEDASVTGLTDASADRIHRFVRLQRHVGLSVRELDAAIASLGGGVLDGACLAAIANLLALKSTSDASLFELLAWWGDLWTTVYEDGTTSIYQRLFLNPAVRNPVDTAFELNSTGTELETPTPLAESHVATIVAALRITQDDYAAMQAKMVAPTAYFSDQLTLSSLSGMYRHASLARQLGLSVRELLALRDVTGIDPFASFETVLEFRDLALDLRKTGVTVAELKYLLQHEFDPYGTVVPPEQSITLFLVELVTEMQRITADVGLDPLVVDPPLSEPDPTGAHVHAALSKVLADPADVQKMMQVLAGDVSDDAFLDTTLGPFWGGGDPSDDLNASTPGLKRFEAALKKILYHLRDLGQVDLLDQKVATHFGVDRATAHGLLFDILTDPGIPSLGTLASRLLDPELLTTDLGLPDPIPPEGDADVYAAYHRLLKATRVIKTFAIASDELEFFFAGMDPWMDLDALPLLLVDTPSSVAFGEWDTLRRGAELRRALGGVGNPLEEIAEAALNGIPSPIEAVLDVLAARSGWDRTDLGVLASELGLDDTDFQRPTAMLQLRDLIATLRRIGRDAATVLPWLSNPAAANAVDEMRAAVKAKYGEDRWAEIARPLRNCLREQQRDALVAYVIEQTPGVATPEELYGHLLLDTEMSACALTSRVKQAISSTQLFIQRVFLGLEQSEFILDEDDAREWEWMKNYRVWEANRKVFVYPENWIDPTLRTRKTPLFKAFENRLLESEITEISVQDAYVAYLEGLHEVAQLDIIGVYNEEVANKTFTSHVIGATHADPPVYYYRRWHRQTEWTPWERVPVDLATRIAVPAVHQGRLYIFWALFTNTALPTEFENEDAPPAADPKVSINAQVAWSEYRNGQWTPKRVSEAHATALYELDSAYVRSVIRIRVASNEDSLQVHVVSPRWTNANLRRALIWEHNPQQDNFLQSGFHEFSEEEANSFGCPVGASDAQQDFLLTQDDDLIVYTAPHGAKEVELLGKLRADTYVTVPHHYLDFYSRSPFAISDPTHLWVVSEKLAIRVAGDEPSPGIVDGPDSDYQWGEQPDDPPPFSPPPNKIATTGIVLDGIESSVAFAGSTPGLLALQLEQQEIVGVKGGTHDASGLSDPADALDAAAKVLDYSLDSNDAGQAALSSLSKRFRFTNANHPYTCPMLEAVRKGGTDELFLNDTAIRRQLKAGLATTFGLLYGPNPDAVAKPHPRDEFDFTAAGAYGEYNWELFCHGPSLIADRLSREQRFDEALHWYHYVFNPLAASDLPVPERYWNIKPFYQDTEDAAVEKLLTMLGQNGTEEEQEALAEELIKQVTVWRKNPFDPHAIARLRPGAYERSVVMKYLDNLIAWGDSLFRRDTIESINEATQIYVLAKQILGDRPRRLPERDPVTVTYANIKGDLDAFGNALVELENFPLLPTNVVKTFSLGGAAEVWGGGSGIGSAYATGYNPVPAPLPRGPLFCVPPNDKLLGYWDTVDDRLFKIRHCQNIEGVVRQLPLFEPPIDPGLLVKAVAAGVDLGAAVAGLFAALPHYRFGTMVQRAVDLCADVRSLGAAMLSALEKRDAEALALLRSSHETRLLEAVRAVREQQIEEARAALDATKQARALAEHRREYYAGLEYMNAQEKEQLKALANAHSLQTEAQRLELLAGQLGLIPDFNFGTSGVASPVLTFSFGGTLMAAITRAAAAGKSIQAAGHQHEAAMAGIVGGYNRRLDDWTFQVRQAELDMQQIDKQIAAAEVRIAIAEKELANHDRQISDAREVDEFMRSKFSNKELYDWMISQMSAIHFQSYQLAFDVAKQAEQAYRWELGLSDSNFVQFGHWDSLRKGLLAGERLQFDLQRMRTAHLENHRRELELTKSISLAELDPVALVKLRETGECMVSIPEVIFDLDYPGHYMRRIKAVTVTVPAVTGPYTTLPLTLTLLHDEVRTNTASVPVYRERVGLAEAIATSSGRSDGGLFELSFRDERYLPFEGAGVISDWQLRLPETLRQFDYRTISDVVFNISYTARDGGEALRTFVSGELTNLLSAIESMSGDTGLMRVFSARQEFPVEWNKFLFPPDDEEFQHLELPIAMDRFPFAFQHGEVDIDGIELVLVLEPGTAYTGGSDLVLPLQEGATPRGNVTLSLPSLSKYGQSSPWGEATFGQGPSPGPWSIHLLETSLDGIHAGVVTEVAGKDRLVAEAIRDLVVIVHYRIL
jgi:hypothetical protein